MKKSFFVLGLMLFHAVSFNCFAESQKYYDEDGQLFKEDNGSIVILYTYNQKGQNDTATYYDSTEYATNSNPVPTQQYRFGYDENGHLETETNYKGQYNIEHDIVNLQHRYTYNGDHIETKTLYNKHGTPTSLYKYTYEENGDIVRIQYTGENITSANPVPTQQYRYSYDEDGKMISSKYYGNVESIESNIPTSEEIYTYQYDKYGNVTAMYINGVLSSSNVYDPKYLHNQWLANRKLIYTIEEARQAVEAAGTDTVNFRIRYK
ncbi:MAG: hypothetical protein J6X42_01860 [Alphaproteobacteria bacterium]|nr:hypothetical protein [Alphaproteobacteria bacterium]